MFGLGFYEWLVILAIVLLLFGGKKLPQLGQALGNAMRGLKKGLRGDDEIAAGDEKPAPRLDDEKRG